MSEIILELKYNVRADVMGFSAVAQKDPGYTITCWRCAPPLWHNTLRDHVGRRVTPILVSDEDSEGPVCECCQEALAAPTPEDPLFQGST